MHHFRQIPIAFVKLRLCDGVLGEEQFQRPDLTAIEFFVRMPFQRERLFSIHAFKQVRLTWYIGRCYGIKAHTFYRAHLL